MTEPDPVVVRHAVDHGTATLTLDSPHNRNALSVPLLTQLSRGLDDAASDPDVRAVVLTHIGGTFCAGADLSNSSGSAQETVAARTRDMAALLRQILELPKPVLARIDGHVRAGGMGLIGACDIVVAGPASTFALTEARLGLAASIISLTVLPRLSSRAAARYFLTGERFGPEEACSEGLVTLSVADTGAVLVELLAEIRACSPQGLAESKRLVTQRILEDFDRYGDDLAARSAQMFGSEEATEGMTAFLQKRRPWWDIR
ncbi:enoyl-CoA hydratase [Rhodococcus rhodochrous]|uniref:enoyl-CoA hydratase family protein n=1 Tax=Rhodococcus rhodochrous TaxID=1829 RepID=UPI0007513C01|nr:enoyl-CoA hydratase family protein [Rhodococcus rhodochrous]MDJ0401640.1 enoyl-CoA hydratase family protein [Rhodococcus rhodochrous]MDO1485408.1 enoyl-CoA hydratase family protein [Rhodococcus rhodochrous]TWH60895.1 enoyl-CoA hydratase [Rhodococcus rhodochrous J38]SNV19635.1 enoyl-CoA hydratase [Rhodococcus rhodochrous]